MPSGMSLWQFRVSRHVPILIAYQALREKYGADLPSDESYEVYEREVTTTGSGSKRRWGGLSVNEIEAVIEIEHQMMRRRGLYPTSAEVRAPLRAAKREAGLSLSAEVVRLAMDEGKPEVAARFDSGAFMVAGLQTRVPDVNEEEFRELWIDTSVSLNEVLSYFTLGVIECERVAKAFGLDWPKPYDDPADDRPDLRLDGLTAAQRHNSAYVQSTDEMRIAVARWCEERGVDRNKLLRIYETQPTARCVGWMGGHHQFYTALGVFDIPLRRGARYAMVDHPEDFPPEPDPRNFRAPQGTGSGRRGVVVVPAEEAFERAEQRAVAQAVAASPAPEPPATEPAHEAPAAPAVIPVVQPSQAGYSVAGLTAQRDQLVARRGELEAALAVMRQSVIDGESEQAQIDLRLESMDKAIEALRVLEEGI